MVKSRKDALAKGGSLNNNSFGIGELSDGSFNSFPANELADRTAKRDREEAADDYAFRQSQKGFPDDSEDADPFLDDDDDLDLEDEGDDQEDTETE